jgi:biuret amidohydrolase
MPFDLASLIKPEITAVITSECQRGVIGSGGALSALSSAVQTSGIIPRMEAILAAARHASLPVLHGIVLRRPDGGGSTMNCRLFAATRKSSSGGLLPGSDAAKLMPELGPEPTDYLVPRYHGVSLFHDTELDSILRSLGIRTVVLVGVSLNIALLGTTIEAVNRGYQVVLPTDAVTGTPIEYATSVLENTLRLLATLPTSDELIRAWQNA